jgi:hypothetical protein
VRAAVSAQSYLGIGLDNYQRVHQKSYQNNGQSSITHRGTVSFIRRMMVPMLPLGSVLKSPWGHSYSVYESTKLNPYRSRLKLYRRINLYSDCAQRSPLQIDILWPTVGWTIESVDEWEQDIPITVLFQTIPSPPQFKIPSVFGLDDCLFRPILPVCAPTFKLLSVEDYWELVCRSQLLSELGSFKYQCERDSAMMDVVALLKSGDMERLVDNDVIYGVTALERRQALLYELLSMCANPLRKAAGFQKRMIRLMNEDTNEVSELILSPLYPRDEVSKKGSLLVNSRMLQLVGLVKSTTERDITLGDFVSSRITFQYGDVLTDDMMHGLRHLVLSRLTDLGKQDYVEQLLSAMDQLVKQHNSLHEQMHMLCAIFSWYYPGFLQAIQAEIKMKRIQLNPMKGSFKDHDTFARLVY